MNQLPSTEETGPMYPRLLLCNTNCPLHPLLLLTLNVFIKMTIVLMGFCF